MEIIIKQAIMSEAEDILELQKIAYQSEAGLYQDWNIPPLLQTLQQLQLEFENHKIIVATFNDEIIGSVRGYVDQDTLHIGRLIVHPDFQKQGIGKELIRLTKLETPKAKLILLAAPKAVNYYPKIGMTRHENCYFLDDINKLK